MWTSKIKDTLFQKQRTAGAAEYALDDMPNLDMKAMRRGEWTMQR
jgi:hypothetical protein